MTAADVIRAAMELPPAEREEVARTLLDSVDEGFDQDQVDEARRDTISGRISAIRSGEVQGLTRDQVRKFLNERRIARQA